MKIIRVYLSVVMALVILFLCTASVSSAIIPNSVEYEKKITDLLMKEMVNKKENDLIPVWVWFLGIDKNKVDKELKMETGYSLKEIKLWNNPQFRSKIDSVNVSKTIDDYYQKRLNRISGMYINKNTDIINNLKVNDGTNVRFISSLTPSAIIVLSKKQIYEVAKINSVVSIDLYSDAKPEASSQANQKNAMHCNFVPSEYSGNNINILQIDVDYVRIDDSNSSDFSNPSNIFNVYQNCCYSADNLGVLPPATNGHGTYVASVINEYAPNANIYAMSPGNFGDIEWALLHLNIHIINQSFVYISQYQNLNNSSYAKWYDGIVQESRAVLIVSSGNSYNQISDDWPNVFVPASCYNSIAVGAYTVNDGDISDRMNPFRYNTIDSLMRVNYKPDVVVAASDTSTGAAALSGITALVLNASSTLKNNPFAVKAVLMASCHRKVLPYSDLEIQETMEEGLSQKQGAGAIDACRACNIAKSGAYGSVTLTDVNTESIIDLVYPSIPNINDSHIGTVDYDDKLNISIAWERNVDNMTQSPNSSIVALPFQELELKLMDENDIELGSSSRINTAKQQVYLTNAEKNHTYSISVENVTTALNLDEVEFGYAWSEKGIKELSDMSIIGITAQGQTLIPVIHFDDLTVPNNDYPVDYNWYRSADGINWSYITKAAQYCLTSNDVFSYIKCVAVPKNNTLITDKTLSSITENKTVIFGDANLDGTVDNDDITFIQQYLVNSISFNSENMIAADVDLNGEIESIDCLYIGRYLSGIIPALPVQ